MRLVFYKTVCDADGRPVGRRVMTIVDRVLVLAIPSAILPADRRGLAHWRNFADFFEIV